MARLHDKLKRSPRVHVTIQTIQTFESLPEPDTIVYAQPKLRPSEDLQACLAKMDKVSLKSRSSMQSSPDKSRRGSD
jgi:hypothetical protein